MSLYTPELKTIIHANKCPYPGFIYDVAEYETYLTLRFYRENFHELSDDKMVGVLIWLNDMMKTIRTISPCYLEVSDYVPTRR